MRHFIAPGSLDRFHIIADDLVGSAMPELPLSNRSAHATLHEHAEELLDILANYVRGPSVVVGHSLGTIISMLASIEASARFETQVMLSAVPCFISAAFE